MEAGCSIHRVTRVGDVTVLQQKLRKQRLNAFEYIGDKTVWRYGSKFREYEDVTNLPYVKNYLQTRLRYSCQTAGVE